MSHNSTQWQVEAHEHALQLSGPKKPSQAPAPPTRENGDIARFSADSRRRLIKKILRLQRSKLSDGSFVSLTYHDDWVTEREDLQQDLAAFLQALRRQYPSAVYIWRLEFQKRGAPHFHLMIWRTGASDAPHLDQLADWVSTTWTRIADQDSEAHARYGADTRRITSWREALAYVTKYVAKTGPEGEVEYSGRRWGASQSLPTAPRARVHMNESAGHVLRRLCRKLVEKTLGKDHALYEHLQQGTRALIAMEPRTVRQMLSYVASRKGCWVRHGPLPDPDHQCPDDLAQQLAQQHRERRAPVR